jgi:hypothetical protein
MDEKMNFAPSNPLPSNPIKTDPPKEEPKNTLTGNPFSPPISSDIKPPESPNSLLSPEPSSSMKVDIESAFNQKSTDSMTSFPEPKKSNKLMLVLGAILLIIIAAGASGYGVYYYLSTQIQPLQKDKALLQSQAGNLKSQVDVLEKDKKNLQSEVTRLQEEAKTKSAAEAQPAQTDQTGTPTPSPSPAPVAPTNPAAPGTGSTPTP